MGVNRQRLRQEDVFMPCSASLRDSFASIAAAAALAGVLMAAPIPASAETADDPWPDLARDAFDRRPLADGAGILKVEMPYRAEDAALVPVTMRTTLPADDGRSVKAITLVIDRNPAPVAGTFTFGANTGSVMVSTRVRVNSYTNVHAVAELSDGNLYVSATHVKASDGCSAPASKNAAEAAANLGQLRLRQFAAGDAASGRREAQIMIRHPNNSGLQMDQVTHLYTPAFFVQNLKVWQGNELIMAMEGGISLSEDPNIRFSYVPNGADSFRAEARDTENQVFRGEWPADSTGM
jgi:sulfur-oxidizing protein SoxY